MLSLEETARANEIKRRRKLRLQQVREQSKLIAQNIRVKIAEDKKQRLAAANAAKAQENTRKKNNPEVLKHQYFPIPTSLGEARTEIEKEERKLQEWQAQKAYNRSKSLERGAKAVSFLKKKKDEEEKTQKTAIERRHTARTILNVPVQKETTWAKKQQFDDKIQHHYFESLNSELDACNLPKTPKVFDVPLLVRDSDEENHNSNQDPSVYRVIPTETLRQMELSSKIADPYVPRIDDMNKPSFPTYSLSSYMNNNEAKVRDFISDTSDYKPFDLISKHIKNRPKNLLPSNENQNLNDLSRIRYTIQHSRQIPNDFTRNQPLFDLYNKNEAEKSTDPVKLLNLKNKLGSDNLSGNGDWLYQSIKDRNEDLDDVRIKYNSLGANRDAGDLRSNLESDVNVKLPRQYKHNHVVSTKPLKSILMESNKNVQRGCRNSRCRSRCGGSKSSTISRTNIRECERFKIKDNDILKSVGCYDQPNKFSKNFIASSGDYIQKMVKSGKNAYQRALDEVRENNEALQSRMDDDRDVIRRIRGEKAMDRVRSTSRNIVFVEDEPQETKVVYIESNKRRSPERIKKNKAASANKNGASDKSTNTREELSKNSSPSRTKSSNYVPQDKVSRQDDSECSRYSADDLDVIPTRDSESSYDNAVQPGLKKKTTKVAVTEPSKSSSSKTSLSERSKSARTSKTSVTEEPKSSKTSVVEQTSSKTSIEEFKAARVDRLICLVEKLMEEEAKIAAGKNTNKDKPRRVLKDSSGSEKSLTSIVEEPKSPSKQSNNTETKNQIVQVKPTLDKPVSTTSSSVSFEGLQILIEVKKGTKKSESKTTLNDKQEDIKDMDSSSEVSIRTSQFMSKKEVRIEGNKGSAVMRFDSSESTAYMSPPEKISTHFEKLIGSNFAKKHLDESTSAECIFKEDKVKNWVETNTSSPEHKINKKSSLEKVGDGAGGDACNVKKNGKEKSKLVKNLVEINAVQQSSNVYSVRECQETNLSERMDPMLKKYIHKLLEISRSGIDKYNLTVSDVTTPGSSVIDVSTNFTPRNQNDFTLKIERLKNMIEENYSLLEELEKENVVKAKLPPKNIKYKFDSIPHSKVSSSDIPSSIVEEAKEMKGNERKIVKVNEEKMPKVKDASESSVGGNICQVFPQKKVLKRKENRNHRSPRRSKKNTDTEKMVTKKIRTKRTPRTVKSSKYNSGNVENTQEKIKYILAKAIDEFDSKDCRNVQDDGSTSSENSMLKIAPIPKENTMADDRRRNMSNELKDREIDVMFSFLSDAEKDIDNANARESNESVSSSEKREDLKISDFKQLSSECEEKISHLTKVINQVRKEKNAILSSSSTPSSDSSKSTNFEISEHTPLITKKPDNLGYVPLMSDIPKPYENNKQGSETLENQIQSSCQKISQDLIDFESIFSPERARPPVALVTNNAGRNIERVTPHELSTIMEVETPKTISSVSRRLDSTPSVIALVNPFKEINEEVEKPVEKLTPELAIQQIQSLKEELLQEQSNKAKEILNLSMPNFEPSVELDKELKPLISLREYLQRHKICNQTDLSLVDQTIKPEEDSSSQCTDDTLPNIVQEMLKRDLIKKPPSSDNSTTHGSGEDSSSVSSKEHQKKDSKTKINLPWMSGVDDIKSSRSTASDKSLNDLEIALKKVGMGWAVSTLKKTKEAAELSSSSSSIKDFDKVRSKPKLEKSSPGKQTNKNQTKSSVGLDTLLQDLQLPYDSVFKDFNAESLSKSSFMKDSDIPWEEIQKLIMQDSLVDVKDKSAKGDEKQLSNVDVALSDDPQNKTKDKTQHRTSTPVQEKSTNSSPVVCSSKHTSNGLFSNESDLSSVRNASSDDRERLSVPNVSLKFGKHFDTSEK